MYGERKVEPCSSGKRIPVPKTHCPSTPLRVDNRGAQGDQGRLRADKGIFIPAPISSLTTTAKIHPRHAARKLFGAISLSPLVATAARRLCRCVLDRHEDKHRFSKAGTGA